MRDKKEVTSDDRSLASWGKVILDEPRLARASDQPVQNKMPTIKEVMLEYVLAEPDYPRTIQGIKSEVTAKVEYDLTRSQLDAEIEKALNELIR